MTGPGVTWKGEDLNQKLNDSDGLTQKERVLLAFTAYGVVCGNTFLTMHIPRYAARVSDLKADGHVIVRTTCPYSHHSHGKHIASYEYQGRL